VRLISALHKEEEVEDIMRVYPETGTRTEQARTKTVPSFSFQVFPEELEE
jgi:hypothetical protein